MHVWVCEEWREIRLHNPQCSVQVDTGGRNGFVGELNVLSNAST